MKIINQIIVVIIFLGILFLVKTDYNSYYSKTLSYLQNSISKSSTIYNDSVNNISDTLNNAKAGVPKAVVKDNIDTPGPLIVSDNFLTSNIANIDLSSKHVIEITNKYRKENGDMPGLIENQKLNFSAEKKLQDMFVKG